MDKNLSFWNRVSKLYTPLQEKQNMKAFKEIADLSKGYVKNKDVLELACGTGQISKYLYKDANSYLATDYSDKMINELNKRAFNGLTTEVADAKNLKYEDNSFDVVLIANALHIIPDVEIVIKEIKRVLKPGGILIAPTFVYDMKVNKFKLGFMKMVGFNTYHKWSLNELRDFIKKFGFNPLDKTHVKAKPAYIGFVVVENEK